MISVAANWFGGNQRTTATSLGMGSREEREKERERRRKRVEKMLIKIIGALANQIGVAVGFYMPAAIATSPSKIHRLLIIQAAMTTAILALVVS